MSYINHINRFWRIFNAEFNADTTAVFFYVLNLLNTQKWPDIIVSTPTQVCDTLKISRAKLRNALQVLQKYQLIFYDQKNGSKYLKFSLQPIKKPIEVFDEVLQPLQKPVQVFEEVSNIYNMNKENKDIYIYKNNSLNSLNSNNDISYLSVKDYLKQKISKKTI